MITDRCSLIVKHRNKAQTSVKAWLSMVQAEIRQNLVLQYSQEKKLVLWNRPKRVWYLRYFYLKYENPFRQIKNTASLLWWSKITENLALSRGPLNVPYKSQYIHTCTMLYSTYTHVHTAYCTYICQELYVGYNTWAFYHRQLKKLFKPP